MGNSVYNRLSGIDRTIVIKLATGEEIDVLGLIKREIEKQGTEVSDTENLANKFRLTLAVLEAEMWPYMGDSFNA